MITNRNLPTTFAESLGQQFGLLAEEGRDFQKNNGHEKRNVMRTFQQMAVAASFQDSLIAYNGQDLDKDQIQALKVIYRSTKPWMLGHVVGVLLDKLDNPHTSNRDFAESVRTIVEQLSESENTPAMQDTKKGLLIKMKDLSQ